MSQSISDYGHMKSLVSQKSALGLENIEIEAKKDDEENQEEDINKKEEQEDDDDDDEDDNE